jgi:hypothetical protein
MAKDSVEKLADIIEKNPNCNFEIDSDCWYVISDQGTQLAASRDFSYDTDWYSHSSNYGAGLSEALVIILNRRGFSIKAEAV